MKHRQTQTPHLITHWVFTYALFSSNLNDCSWPCLDVRPPYLGCIWCHCCHVMASSHQLQEKRVLSFRVCYFKKVLQETSCSSASFPTPTVHQCQRFQWFWDQDVVLSIHPSIFGAASASGFSECVMYVSLQVTQIRDASLRRYSKHNWSKRNRVTAHEMKVPQTKWETP